jgi:hypothetical protein
MASKKEYHGQDMHSNKLVDELVEHSTPVLSLPLCKPAATPAHLEALPKQLHDCLLLLPVQQWQHSWRSLALPVILAATRRQCDILYSLPFSACRLALAPPLLRLRSRCPQWRLLPLLLVLLLLLAHAVQADEEGGVCMELEVFVCGGLQADSTWGHMGTWVHGCTN